MKIVIFGATGIVGKAITNEALAQGHDVTVVTRDAGRVEIKNDRLSVIEGDVRDRATVRRVIEGKDAVIQSLGIGGKGDGRPTTFVSETNKLIMDEMTSLGVRRYVVISVIGAGNSLRFLPWIYRKMMPLFMEWFQAIIDDKNRMEPMIEKSGLDWTIVRCTTVKDTRTKNHITATLDGKGIKYTIAAPDMAKFVVARLGDSSFMHQAPVISN